MPISAVTDAMAAAEAARRQLSMASSPGGGGGAEMAFAGLAMLLEASEESPFRTDFAAVAGAVGNGGGNGVNKNRRRVGAGALGSPLRPVALNGNGNGGGGGGGGWSGKNAAAAAGDKKAAALLAAAVGSPDMAKGQGGGTSTDSPIVSPLTEVISRL